MAKDELYKLDSWSETDKDNFFSWLNRSKSSLYKAQYLNNQANYLCEKFPDSAIELCNIVINEYPEPGELSNTYYTKAKCFILQGKDCEIIESFRNSIEAMRQYPNSRNYAFLHFGYWAVINNKTDLFDELLDLTLEFQEDIIFPKDNYLVYGIHAIVHYYKNYIEQSKLEAQKAIEHANKIHSGFKSYPNIGLVGDKEKETMFYKKLIEISAS